MSDIELQELKRTYDATPASSEVARQYYKALFRHGQQQEALAIRASMGYVEEVSALPIPTDAQTRAFAEYVAGAHSWYKHMQGLDNCPSRLYFFLRPDAGLTAKGQPVTKTYHYSDKLTEDYLKEFGYWSYWVDTHTPLAEPMAHKQKFQIFAEARANIELPDSLVFFADVTNHVHKGTFKKPYSAMQVGILEEEHLNSDVPYFDMHSGTASYGWRGSTREEVVKKRLCLRKMYQAQRGFLKQLKIEIARG